MKKLITISLGLLFLTGSTVFAWDTPKKDKVALKATQQKANKATAPSTKATAPKNVKQKASEVKTR